MQISRRFRIDLKLPYFNIIMTVFALILAVDAEDSTSVQPEEPAHRFHMGYDQGISARYQINKFWTTGLVISSERWGSLFSSSSDTSYRGSRLSSNDFRRSEDFFLYVDAIKLFKRWHYFTIRGFASAGGGRYKEIRNMRYFDPDGGSTDIYTDNLTTIKVAGRAGLMPGFSYGIFTIELRLGLEGTYSITDSPENTSNRSTGESTNISLIYPNNLLSGFMIHVALF